MLYKMAIFFLPTVWFNLAHEGGLLRGQVDLLVKNTHKEKNRAAKSIGHGS